MVWLYYETYLCSPPYMDIHFILIFGGGGGSFQGEALDKNRIGNKSLPSPGLSWSPLEIISNFGKQSDNTDSGTVEIGNTGHVINKYCNTKIMRPWHLQRALIFEQMWHWSQCDQKSAMQQITGAKACKQYNKQYDTYKLRYSNQVKRQG
jgi:hypothetical protein